MKYQLIISPPFGNWISLPLSHSIKGSYTLEPRPGLVTQILKTLRWNSKICYNNIGLRNPGIKSVQFQSNNIYSLVGFSEYEWHTLRRLTPKNSLVELNLGCKNVNSYTISSYNLKQWFRKFPNLIIKLPATNWEPIVERAYKIGIRYFHCCNTLWTPQGSISGPILTSITYPMIESLLKKYSDIRIIGGGGIYSWETARSYFLLGVSNISIATIFLHPIKLFKFLRKYYGY